MGKKRGKDKTSKEDDELDLTAPSCRHIKKGTDQTLLKKLSGTSDWTSCQDCKQEENKENINNHLPQEAEEEQETGLWMCLKCGHRGCGRNSENQHAIKHYETPRSDPHCLVVSLDNFSVWCYICDDEVHYSRTGHLAQLVTNLKKQTSSDPIKRPQKHALMEAKQKAETVKEDENEDKENKENGDHQKKNTKKETVGKSQKKSTTEEHCGVSVKGLSNLGNTCFFNAVIQNLSQTQRLRQTLNKVTEEKSLNIKPGASLDLEPIEVQLDGPGSLTLAMYHLLCEIQESKKSVVTPRELFTQVCRKAARFKGFQQQDSQELLRYLLDGMRAEEHNRISSGIMDTLKQSREGTDGELKTLLKEYEKNGFLKNFVDQVFGGEITSTIMCQQLREYILMIKKNPKKKTSASSQDDSSSPVRTSGNDDIPTGAGSKYQQKKAKKQAKKQAKHQKRQQKLEGRATLDSLTSPSQAESEHTDATAESKDRENTDNETLEEDSQHPAPVSVSEEDQKPCNAVQVEQEKEEDEDSASDPDSSVSNRFTALSVEQHSKDKEEDTQLVRKMSKVTLDDAFIEDTDAMEQSMESEDGVMETKEYTVINQDPELAFHTMAVRTIPEKQECSVQSCLFQFTEVETLTQNNSLLCVTCTKRQLGNNKSGGSKKNIYTDALKQILISSPPSVLTLHLKRFQQNGYSICKVNRHVTFPMILDLAPFCAVKCKNIPEGHSQILYGLYGIVEHSGTMRSGHYTAYVKVRPECPQPSSNGLTDEPSRGSWFHISDTSVQPVSESKVQSCQAYLLFYERLL
uniref:Ubiquitin carboxyl-terminal hydrolase n=1 Tax=Pundamilia nyererei TaxID=303518 RepID=A0A3B4FSS7_9CICH